MSSSTRRSFLTDTLKTVAGAWVTISGVSLLGCNSCSPTTKYGGPPVEPPAVETKYGGPSMMEPDPDAKPPTDPEGPAPTPDGSSRQ
jgi:hypothetical protein